MQSIDTLTDFLAVAGANHKAQTEYRIYDLSRIVKLFSTEEFRAIENGERPFPYPRQQHAWLGIVLRQKERQESNQIHDPYIWFVKLPLDERGLFQHAARQHFLSIIVAALGENPTAVPTAEQEKRQQQNPYIFTPNEPRRAAFHAQVSHDLQFPASLHYTDALAFLRGETASNTWQDLGVQGIHDVIVRNLHEPSIQKHIYTQLLQWPQPLQQTLMEALEHAKLPATLAQNFIGQLQSAAPEQQITLLRCLADASKNTNLQSTVHHLLATCERQLNAVTSKPADTTLVNSSQDLLLTIGARNWAALSANDNLERYLGLLATINEHVFIQVFRDLVMLPELRGLMLQLFRKEQLSPALQRGIANLVAQTRSS